LLVKLIHNLPLSDNLILLIKSFFIKRKIVLNLGLSLFLIIPTLRSQDCAISNEVTIVSQGSSNIILNVEGLVNDDLGSNQALCGVRLVFNHDLIENVRMVLVSPSGQRVTLAGPGRINSNPSPFVNWNIAFVPCSVPNVPDPGISGTFDNGEPWAAFTNYTGVYHPFDNCLEDFNIGSANGAWLLEVENLGDIEGALEFFQLIFCDQEGSNCSECFLFSGNFNFSTPGGIYTFCETDPNSDLMNFQLDQDSIITNSQDFAFIYSRNDTIVKFSDSPNEISNLTPGTYSLCGLAFQSNIEDLINEQILFSTLDSLIESRTLCADLTEDCITLRILEIENKVNIDTIFCDGDSISFFGDVFYDDIDTSVIISNLSQDRCDSLIILSARRKVVDAIIDNSSNISQCGSSVFLNANNSSTNIGSIDDFGWMTNDGVFEIDIGPISEASSGGTYYLNAQSEQCFDIDSIEILQIDTFDLNVNTLSPECFLDSFVINVSSIPVNAEFQFNGPSNVESINNQSFYAFEEGLYQIIANLGTCEDSLEFNLIHDATELTVEVSSSIVNCFIDSSEIVINTNAINANFEISGPLSLISSHDTIYSNEGGLFEILVIDDLGCEIKENFTVIEDLDPPIVELQNISHLCNEMIPNLSAMISSPFDSILWEGPENFQSNILNESPINEGIYYLTVFGLNGCISRDSLFYEVLNVAFPLEIDFNDIDCVNTESLLCYSNPNNFDIEWTFNNSIISENSCFTTSQGGEYIIEVIDNNGCFEADTINVNDLSSEIEVNVGSDTGNFNISCNQPEISLSAEIIGSVENLSFQWLNGNDLINETNNVTINNPMELLLKVTDTISKCFFEEIILVQEILNPFEEFDIDVIQPVCQDEKGQIIELSPIMLDQFDVFLNGSMVFDFQELKMLPAGDYLLEIIDQNSCTIDTSFTIETGRVLSLDLGEDIQTVFGTTVSIDGEININDSEIDNYDWSNQDSLDCANCLTPSLSVFSNDEIVLEITDIFGCQTSDTLNITINNDVNYFVPNVFSPNDDGDNDELTLYLSDAILKVFDFRVMDRWGNLVLFHPEILNENDILVWNGFFKGKPVVQGVYVYVAKLLLIDGTETLITGDITVIR